MEHWGELSWGQRREACDEPPNDRVPQTPVGASPEIARERLTACIITFNDEHHIANCIRSVKLCDEVLVIDAHSSDATREIAQGLGARVIERDWPGYEAQHDYAVQQARHDWVLCLNAHERLSVRLQQQIQVWQAVQYGRFVAFSMPRSTQYLGRFLRHGHACSKGLVRLFNRTHTLKRATDARRGAALPGPVRHLTGVLEQSVGHDPVVHTEHNQHCAALSAQWMVERGQRCRLASVLLRPLARFVHGYVLRAGFLDGWRGLLFAYMEAAYVRHQYFCLFFLQRGRGGRIF